MEKRIKQFTHPDLDGVMASVVMDYFTMGSVDAEYLNYSEINPRIEEYIENEEYKNFSSTYITDISVSEEIAEKIQKLVDKGRIFGLLDHHQTALPLNKFSWCNVKLENKDGKATCGAELTLDSINTLGYGDDNIRKLVECTRKRDTWDFADCTEEEKKYIDDINSLLFFSRELFLEEVGDKTMGDKPFQYKIENMLSREVCKALQEEKEAYIENALSTARYTIKPMLNKAYKIGYIFAEKFVSELGNELCKNPKVDFAMIINMRIGVISFRSAKDIDVSKIAAGLGGGGHKHAAAAKVFTDEKAQELIEKLLN